MSSPFTDGSTVIFGVPDSPLSAGIIESINFSKNSKVTKIYDANGQPTGKTVTVDFGEYSAKVQLGSNVTGTTGPTINIGTILNTLNNSHSVMVVKASAVYTQGAYAYQSIEAIDQVNSVSV